MSVFTIPPDDVIVVAVPDHYAFDFYSRTTGLRIGWLSKREVAELGPERTPQMILDRVVGGLPKRDLTTVRATVSSKRIFENMRMLLNPSHAQFMDVQSPTD